MKKNRFYIPSLFLFLMFSLQSFAQIVEPAKWSFQTKKLSSTEVELQFSVTLDKDWHMYSQYTDPKGGLPLSFSFEKNTNYQLIGKVVEPKPKVVYDEVFKVNVSFFSDKVTFRQKVKVLSAEDFVIKGSFKSQLCNDETCISHDDDFSFSIKGIKELADTTILAITDTLNTQIAKDTIVNCVEKCTASENPMEPKEEQTSLWVVFFVAFGVGLLALITPCVFPMIPMTVSFFMKGSGNRKKGLRQALMFGLSIVFIFTVLGLLLTLLLGDDAMTVISRHWIPNLIFFVIFMFFAFSFFGLFDLTLPSWMINKSDEKADKGGFLAPFFIALTTVLVSFTCAGPILGSALIELSTEGGSRLVPLISMLGFAIGFALPFTFLAVFPSLLGKLKSGSWLNTVKITFGFIEVALALKFLSTADLGAGWGLLSRDVYLSLWIVVFSFMGFYFLGKLRFKGDAPTTEISVFRLFLSIITFSFVVYMIPGLWGDPLKAISGYIPPIHTQDFDMVRVTHENTQKVLKMDVSKLENTLPKERKYSKELHLPTGFEGFFDLEEAKTYARAVNKPIFIDFTGITCSNCREMESYVFAEPSVMKLLNDEFVMVALYHDVEIELPKEEWVTTKEGKIHKTIGRRNKAYQVENYKSNTLPYYVLIDSENNVLTKKNKTYDRSVDNFVDFLKEGLANYKDLSEK